MATSTMGSRMQTTNINQIIVPLSKMDLKIVMVTSFTIIQLPTMQPLVPYNVDKVFDMDMGTKII